jgi:hypothetical protein
MTTRNRSTNLSFQSVIFSMRKGSQGRPLTTDNDDLLESVRTSGSWLVFTVVVTAENLVKK